MDDMEFKNLKYIRTVKELAISKNKPTLRVFEIWQLEVSREIFNSMKGHKNVVVVPEKSLNNFSYNQIILAGNCKFLNSKVESNISLPRSGTLRVSMAALVSIKFEDKVLLFFDRENQKCKPFGGAYFFQEGCPILSEKSLRLDKPDTKDLRFMISSNRIPEVIKWFDLKVNRETNPLRELTEELCIENNILTPDNLNKIL